jgi:hypothetical protein
VLFRSIPDHLQETALNKENKLKLDNPKTVVEHIFYNWESMSRYDFDEYMLNNKQTLLREEKEQMEDYAEENSLKVGTSTGIQLTTTEDSSSKISVRNDVTYAKVNAVAVTSVAVSSSSAVVTRNIFNGTFTALAGTSGTGISVARRAAITACTGVTTTGTYTATNHGLVTGQIVTVTGFVTNAAFNISATAITVTNPNTFTATISSTSATETIAAVAQVTRGTAITTVSVPYGASVSSAVAGTGATTGFNVPGSVSYNPDLPIDRVIKSNEDPTS